MAGSRTAFERTNYVRGNPAAIEIACLGEYALIVHETVIDAARIEREVVSQWQICCVWLRVAPGRAARNPGTDLEIPIDGRPFELAESAVGNFREKFTSYVLTRYVVSGGVTGFEYAPG